MKSVILAIALSAFSFSAAAETKLETSEILAAVIMSASTAKLVDSDGQVIERDVASVLGDFFATSNSGVNVGEDARITSVSGGCDQTSVSPGQQNYDCSLMIGDGDYEKTADGFKGPSLESGVVLTFKIIKTYIWDSKPVIRVNGNITALFAG